MRLNGLWKMTRMGRRFSRRSAIGKGPVVRTTSFTEEESFGASDGAMKTSRREDAIAMSGVWLIQARRIPRIVHLLFWSGCDGLSGDVEQLVIWSQDCRRGGFHLEADLARPSVPEPRLTGGEDQAICSEHKVLELYFSGIQRGDQVLAHAKGH
jgi:hypothetical protein